jgi:pyrroloquinoline quinone (PQQ) biosynthesis protein C
MRQGGTVKEATAMSPDAFIEELWEYARTQPVLQHPWYQGILQHRWTAEQIVLGEVQHYLRVRTNPIFLGYVAVNAIHEQQYDLMEMVIDNFLEELGGERNHVDILLQFLEEAGISREEADQADPAPGTMAAIEMIVGGCQRRSALEGLALLSFPEAQNGGKGGAADSLYHELIGYYGFSRRAAETYYVHAVADEGHGDRQIAAIRRYATDAETQEKVRRAVHLGVTAFTLEWDGHVQAMTGHREFWSGLAHLSLRQPQVRLPAARGR